MDAREFKTKLLIEQHAERTAVRIVRGINFTHCLKLNNIDPSCTVLDFEKDTEIIIQGRDIYNKKTVEKFLAQLDIPIELGWLTGNVGLFASGEAKWLRNGGYTKRYQYIKSPTSRKWLRNSTRITAILRMMEHKHATHNFVDDWAEYQMSNILLARSFSEETNEAINHAIKHKEDAEALIEKTYLKYLALLESREFVSYEPLPGLPSGTPDPLALPEEDEEEEDDA